MYKSSLIFLCTGLFWLGATTDLLAQSVRVSGRGVRVQVGVGSRSNYPGAGGYNSNRYDHRGNYPYSGNQVIIRSNDNVCCECEETYRRDRYYRQNTNYYPSSSYPDTPYYQRYRGY